MCLAFAKPQLARYTLVSMNGAYTCSTYPGHAESFCIVDVLTPDQKIVAVSDNFVLVTAYPRA
ncbi:hypothetical protein LX36DRAFT_654647 [Colletotrichum falcatum]|nr:hypothetical protein LX36DRAFT_654647 [Colletotrichum falcatum]